MPKKLNTEVLAGEIWRPVPDLEDSFEVSNFSRVRNKTTKHVIGPQLNGSKYLFFMLYDRHKKKRIKRYLHRMVAQQFIPNPYKSFEVNHIDGNKMNNSVENLEWVTASQNHEHAIRMGLRSRFIKKGDTSGEKNPCSKLTWKDVEEIRNWKEEIKPTLKQIRRRAKKYGVSFGALYNVIKGVTWKPESMPTKKD